MPKRTSRDELDGRLNSVARDAFLLDMQAAGGDIGRVSLAVAQWRAEEMTKEAPTQKSGVVRFFESTLIGKPVAVLVENIEASIAEHGPILGTARGLLIGIMIAAALIAVSEATLVGFTLLRTWLDYNQVNKWKSDIVTDAWNRTVKKRREDFCRQHPADPDVCASTPSGQSATPQSVTPAPTTQPAGPATQAESPTPSSAPSTSTSSSPYNVTDFFSVANMHVVDISDDQYNAVTEAAWASDTAKIQSTLQDSTEKLATAKGCLEVGIVYTVLLYPGNPSKGYLTVDGPDGKDVIINIGAMHALISAKYVLAPKADNRP